MRALLAAAWLLAAGSAAGSASGPKALGEDLAVLGWNNACSVAIRHIGYGTTGADLLEEPLRTRIGTLTIPPGEDASHGAWAADWTGSHTWNKVAAKKALQELTDAGYKRPGFQEDIRIPLEGPPHPFEEVILSTAAFGLRAQLKRPGGDWRWEQVRYSALGDCGLFIFTRRPAGRPFYRYSLLRFYNPSARIQRAQAHMTNSRLLFEASDLEGALAETATAAHLQPDLAANRYRHAALLCLSGQLNESVAELDAAVRRDPKLAARARSDPDFSEVYEFPRFRDLVGDAQDYVPADPRTRSRRP
ncbi:MAG: hypothetical protein NTY77_15530 [Elusimicrobia bacterium]|nr:hypothetical protein [Elusimicrobiota bacterium]